MEDQNDSINHNNNNSIEYDCDFSVNCVSGATLVISTTRFHGLGNIGSIFLYLNKNRKQILNPLLNNINIIRISVFGFGMNGILPFKRDSDKIFGFESNIEYSVDKKVIECENCDLSVSQLGVLFQNIAKWCDNIIKKYGRWSLNFERRWVNLKLSKQVFYK